MAKIEWKTREEIDRERNTPTPPTVAERVEALELAMLEMVLGGGLNGVLSGIAGSDGQNHS